MKFEKDVQCPHCAGSGLYSGMAESKDAAVVCSRCDGTGHHVLTIEYDVFTGMKEPKHKIKRVYETNPGIGIGECVVDGKQITLEDFGGMSYEDWKAKKPFPLGSEMRKFVCPRWWVQSVRWQNLEAEWCRHGFGAFDSCPHFRMKDICWGLYDNDKAAAKDDN